MSKIIQIVASPSEAFSEETIQVFLKKKNLWEKDDSILKVRKKSIDARQRDIKINLRVEIYKKGEEIPPSFIAPNYLDVSTKPKVIVVGAGPAGLFCALKLIELQLCPIVIERGLDVRARRRDLANINKKHLVNPESNYCFGEGGAGTYSDGKLYTRSTKRGDVQSILNTMVYFGANENILTEAHPHIGTNKLPGIISSMREQIIASGGEVRFSTKLTDIVSEKGVCTGVVVNNEETIFSKAIVLATGHSARDIFYLLDKKHITIEFKPFALGVRAEHPQSVIDKIQYHCEDRGEYLPPASYSLVEQVEGKGVYSFCMCPGGIIAPCATDSQEVVTNGWSPSKRNNPWANSGMVVTVNWEDIPEFHQYGPLAGLEFQKSVEHKCWQAGGMNQTAPAQRIIDFIENKKSTSLPECSYQPGLKSVNLQDILPFFITNALRRGLKSFGKKMRGYLHPEAIIVATESRTSSPVRIPRDPLTLEHICLKQFYPCGEGAGYAGGIVSAAIDGEKIAIKIAERLADPQLG